MKLKNKKTGEIVIFGEGIVDLNQIGCKNVAEMMEAGWEDVPEEPKKYYYITSCGETTHRGYRLWENESIYDKNRKQIGNYFETEEEAKRALNKLKALKRLKDKGLKFDGYHIPAGEIHFNMTIQREAMDDFIKDMDICFGGEE